MCKQNFPVLASKSSQNVMNSLKDKLIFCFSTRLYEVREMALNNLEIFERAKKIFWFEA